MEKQHKISVIIPVFNSLKWLEKCVTSVLNQTYKNLEIILVDDGSTDGSEKLCDDYAKKDKRVVVVHQKNGGLSAARNTGLEKASGDFVAFADSDDYLETNMLEKLHSSLLEKEADIVICGFVMEDESGKEYADTPALENKTFSSAEALELLTLPRQDRFVVAWNKLYKKELFKFTRFPVGKIHEDQWVAHKLFFTASKVATIQDELYHYVIHASSIMQASNPIRHFDDIDALFDRIQFYKSKNLSSLAAGVEKTMFNLFAFYREKVWAYENFTLAELKKVYAYGKKCKKYLKNTAKINKYSKNEIKEHLKVYNFSTEG